MEKAAAEEPWFGIEQEYTLLNSTTKRPLGARRRLSGPQSHVSQTLLYSI